MAPADTTSSHLVINVVVKAAAGLEHRLADSIITRSLNNNIYNQYKSSRLPSPAPLDPLLIQCVYN